MKEIISVENFKIQYPMLWRKIDILCHGLRCDNEGLLDFYYRQQNPHDTKRTGNAGLQIKIDSKINDVGRLALNVAVYKDFCKASPYYLCKDEKNQLCVIDERDNTLISVVCPETHPTWYDKKLFNKNSNKVIGDLILLEGDSTAIASITRGCLYFNKTAPCKFCAIGADSVSQEEIVSRRIELLSALEIVANDKEITNFHLTGGNTFNPDRGALDFIPYIRAILKSRPDATIAVEISPPELSCQETVFRQLKLEGVHSITMNMEFWDDASRLELMPLKGAIPKEEYMSAYRSALQIFGKNKVTCGFIIGLEKLQASKAGIDTITSENIIAEVYPFKPNTGSILQNNTISSTDDMIEISLYANMRMKENGISPYLCSGCVKCGACGLTQQLINI
ncbi:MAG: hypothetical protein NC311_09775 [Muribaculaceae bacterium]|nr:hypothetical protein [Muribaculaceae bacterium]